MNNLNQKEEVKNLSRAIYHNYCKGDFSLWFSLLHPNSIWIGQGEPILIGGEKIKDFFNNYPASVVLEVINETFFTTALSKDNYIVTGNVLIGTDKYSPVATVLMTFVFRYISNEPKLMYQHLSYDYVAKELTSHNESTDLLTRLLIRQTFLMKEAVPPVAVKIGQQIYYIPSASIIYLQSNRHKTIIYCVDKELECSMLLPDIMPMLPDNFYFVRRGCVINTMYVTSIRRCEVELLFGTTIQIPVPSYTKVKKDIHALVMLETDLSPTCQPSPLQ